MDETSALGKAVKLTTNNRIYVVRQTISSYFEYRISHTEAHLEELNKQRDITIEKLKAATRYNSTQELLEKYGGVTPKPTPPNSAAKAKAGSKNNPPPTKPGQRTGIPPPPTANIPGRNALQQPPSTPKQAPSNIDAVRQQQPRADTSSNMPSESFAPNAYPSQPQYHDHPKWYDRLMDILLGEDETLARNRMALICQQCKLVNGQAPPGVRSVEELGQWKCAGCGSMNGTDNEAKKLVEEMTQRKGYFSETKAAAQEAGQASETSQSSSDESMIAVPQVEEVTPDDEDDQEIESEEMPQEEPVKRKRGRPRGSGKKV